MLSRKAQPSDPPSDSYSGTATQEGTWRSPGISPGSYEIRVLGDQKNIWHEEIIEAIGRFKERYPRVARYFQITYEQDRHELRWEENSASKQRAARLDGTYLLKTDRLDLGPEEPWRLYILLTQVEDAFRDLKSPLSERPIFHQLQHRVETHIFLCVLAYHLLISIEKSC